MIHIKREVKLALAAIVAVLILIWGINFLKARALFDRNNVFYGVYEQVDGLKVSSSVVYRGYSVGQVSQISFTGEMFDKVLVQFTVGKKLQIPQNTIAVIQSADLMGSKAINLLPGNSHLYAESGDTLQTRLEFGIMQQLNEQLEPLKQKAINIMVSLDTVLVALQEILGDDAKGNIRGSLKSVSNTLDNMEAASGTLNNMLARESVNISEILDNINSITENLRNNNSVISRSLDNIGTISDSLRAANISRTVHNLNRILLQTDSIVEKINRGKGTLGEFVNDDGLYYNLNAVSENLNMLLSEFRANPKRFVNLSLIDFSSNKTVEDDYGIVVATSEKPLPLNTGLLLEYPYLKQIRKSGEFLYIIGTYRNLRQAEKDLKNVNKTFKDAFIVKIR